MFVSENLVFVELHKTACTHIGKWLARMIPGEQIGKHNRVPESLWDRFVLGSIRNPWDWYVSLWAYGCSGRGSVFDCTTGRAGIRYGVRRLPAEMGRKWPVAAIARQSIADLTRPVRHWQDVYGDAADARQFRAWLRRMFDYERRFDIGEGFGFTSLSKSAGLLSYRFLKLFARLGNRLYDPELPADAEAIRDLWNSHRLTRYEIRMEHLEADLLEALGLAGIPVSDELADRLAAARDKPTNTSDRLPPGHYYDDDTIALVADRERLIVDLYGYTAPAPRPSAGQ